MIDAARAKLEVAECRFRLDIAISKEECCSLASDALESLARGEIDMAIVEIVEAAIRKRSIEDEHQMATAEAFFAAKKHNITLAHEDAEWTAREIEGY